MTPILMFNQKDTRGHKKTLLKCRRVFLVRFVFTTERCTFFAKTKITIYVLKVSEISDFREKSVFLSNG